MRCPLRGRSRQAQLHSVNLGANLNKPSRNASKPAIPPVAVRPHAAPDKECFASGIDQALRSAADT